MSERKNIEHLFQEKLDNYTSIPPEEVWNAIEIELNKNKEKRRIIPFWWKISGIAALLVLGYSLYTITTNYSEKNTTPTNESIVGKETVKPTPTNSENNASKEVENQIGVKNESVSNAVAGDKNGENNNESISNAVVTNNRELEENANSSKIVVYKGKTKLSKSKSNSIVNSSKERLANHSKTNKEEKTTAKQDVISSKNESIAQTNNNVNNSQNNVEKSTLNENKTIAETSKKNTKVYKKAMEKLPTIVKEEVIKKEDSTSIAKVELNAMEELLKEKEEKSTQKQKINRWRVTPNLAPIYFGSFTNGSPIDESLSENKKTYNTNMSYGLNVDYAVNKKIKIRTGVNVFSVDYDTQGIVFYQDTNAKMMRNISPTQQGMYIQIKPLNNVSTQLDRVVSERFDGVLNQRMGYIEMPVEMTYKLFGRRLGVDLSGGFSTLFLNKNEIFLQSDGYIRKIGTATNLNNIHFSTNLGLGFNYAVFKNFDARIEPTFKYQINTFSSDAGSFNPYIFGIYSGISYKF